MKKIIPMLFLLILLSGCASQSERFDAMLRDSLIDAVSQNGLNAHYYLKDPAAYGVKKIPQNLGRIDHDNINSRKDFDDSVKELESYNYDELTPSQQRTYDVLKANLDIMEKGLGYGYYEEVFYPRTGAQSNIPILLAEYRIENEQDIKSYFNLLKDVDGYFKDLCVYEHGHAYHGFFMPDRMVDETLAVCRAFIEKPEENFLISSFEERLSELNLPANKAEQYLKKNKKLVLNNVLPAYQNLIDWLVENRGYGVNDAGLSNVLRGDKYYEYLVAQKGGSDKTVDEIAALLDSYIAECTSEVRAILIKNPELYENPNLNYSATTSEECTARLKAALAADYPEMPEANETIKYLPKSLQDMATAGFYLTPPLDDAKENIIYINENQPGAALFPLLAHEGYPGHLYQTVYFNSVNDVPLRNLFSFLGYSEGWATYVEQESYAWAGSNSSDLVRLTNLTKTRSIAMMARMEIGVHYNEWDRKKFAQYYATFGVTDPISVESMYEYCLTDPVGHIPYIVGYLEIMELRRDMEAKLGAEFNLKSFHKAVLDVGPAPFSVVRKAVEAALIPAA